MFGCVRLKNVFRTAVKRECGVKFADIACQASRNVVVSGRFIYLVQDNIIQVVYLADHILHRRPESNPNPYNLTLPTLFTLLTLTLTLTPYPILRYMRLLRLSFASSTSISWPQLGMLTSLDRDKSRKKILGLEEKIS